MCLPSLFFGFADDDVVIDYTTSPAFARAKARGVAVAIPISGRDFEGPYASADGLRDNGGIYVIVDLRSDGKYYVVDVGESGQIRTRVQNHDRADCWSRHQQGSLSVAVLYTPGWTDDQRRALEGRIRDQYAPRCGVA